MAFFYYQKPGEARVWHEALSDQRQKIISSVKPPYVTVLDLIALPDNDWSQEDFNKMAYSGPFYADWDSEDIGETIKALNEFLDKLVAKGVNLNAIRLYATGGRGFHCEIPEPIYNPKPTRAGVVLLPIVLREMATELVTDTMDMLVYSTRKGRMWRCPGVQRENGKYKVPITAEDARTMTPQRYAELTSTPRMEIVLDAPTSCPDLNVMFQKGLEKVKNQAKYREKTKGDIKLLERYDGEFPPTVLNIMQGIGIAPGKGFHPIAMQLAITAIALGKTKEELVDGCDGLCKAHTSDSQRYNSPRKRKEEIRRLYDYFQNEGLYGYSRGSIRALVDANTDTSDLDSPLENAGVGTVEDEATNLPAELLADMEMSASALLEGVLILKQGIFRRTAEGAKPLSNLSMLNPVKLVDAEDGLQVGLEVDLFSDNRPMGRELVPMNTFRTRASMNDFCTGRSAVFHGTDTNASAVQLSLSRKAMVKNHTTYIVRKEGLDIVTNPSVRTETNRHVLWVSVDAVLGKTGDVLYRFQPKVATGAVFRSDVHNASKLEDTPESRAWLRAVLTMNNPVIIAQMFGWFVSCFHKQFYQIAYSQFPLLHPNGTAGSGKTLTSQLFARMFYLTSPVVMLGCSPSASSNFSLKSAWTGSASIPVLLDEYKPSELPTARQEFLLQHFRMIYNQASGASGGINRGAAESSFRDITQYTYSAPTVYLGESQEMQTAIVQRSIPVGFQESESKKYTPSFDIASDVTNQHYFSRLGKELLMRSLVETVDSRRSALDPIRSELRKTMDKTVHDRQVYNMAVVLCGLRFLGDCLNGIFGEEFDEAIDSLCNNLMEFKDDLNTFAMPESLKVINDMSLIARTESSESENSLREGYEYAIGEGFIDIAVKEAFVKYFSWCNRKGFKPLYSSADGFINSLAKSAVVMDRICFDSEFRKATGSKVFRLSLEKLAEGGVEEFKSKSLG